MKREDWRRRERDEETEVARSRHIFKRDRPAHRLVHHGLIGGYTCEMALCAPHWTAVRALWRANGIAGKEI